jgi:transposase
VVERRFRTVSIGLKPVFLHARIQRLHCRSCGQTLQEDIKFAEEKKSTPGP